MQKSTRTLKNYEQIRFLQAARKVLTIVLAVVLVAGVVFLITNLTENKNSELHTLLSAWDSGKYKEVFESTAVLLQKQQSNFLLLTLHGFSAFQLAISQITNDAELAYIDECIWTLRKALLLKEGSSDWRVKYVLGKAYYYKGESWADAAVKYLEEAQADGCTAPDVSEYLGLSYASIHNYKKSVQSYADVLNQDETSGEGRIKDLVLLDIAKSYMELDEFTTAKAYLLQCLDVSGDHDVLLEAELLLAGILASEGETSEAESRYLAVLEQTGESARVRYYLGLLYESSGDITRARSEWRQAIRADPTFENARKKLSL